MNVAALIAEFHRLNSSLKAALRGDTDIGEVADLVRAVAAKQHEIETACPTTPRGVHEKMQFLLARAREEAPTARERSAIDLAADLLKRRAAAWPARTEETEPVAAEGGAVALTSPSLVSYVSHAADRVSLIGTDFLYRATSPANAAFYGRPQDDFPGRHVVEIVGPARFELRVKARLEAAFDGTPQEYVHDLPDNSGETRHLRCQMKPVRFPGGGAFGALVYLRDVTEEIGEAGLLRSA